MSTTTPRWPSSGPPERRVRRVRARCWVWFLPRKGSVQNGATADTKALADKESIMLAKHLRLARHTLRTLPAHD